MTKSPEVILTIAIVALIALAGLSTATTDDLDFVIKVGTIILAPIATYFVWQRNRSFDRQANTAEANLQQAEKRTTNDNFVKAIELLGASDGEGDPILEQRLGAIYALERLARDNLDYHVQIMETLCAYVRQHAPARPGDVFPGTVLRRLEREQPGITDEEIAEDPGFKAANERMGFQVEELREWREQPLVDPCLTKWLDACNGPREDIRAVLDVLSRRMQAQLDMEKGPPNDQPHGPRAGYRLDLRHTHLRKMAPAGRQFARALLTGAQMEGANLRGAQMEGADLGYSLLTGTNDSALILSSTNLSTGTNNGGVLRFVDFSDASFTQDFIHKTFGDATVTLPQGIQRPPQWLDHAAKDDTEFYGAWRGWVEAGPHPDIWPFIAPAGFKDVKAIPPPNGLTWD